MDAISDLKHFASGLMMSFSWVVKNTHWNENWYPGPAYREAASFKISSVPYALGPRDVVVLLCLATMKVLCMDLHCTHQMNISWWKV